MVETVKGINFPVICFSQNLIFIAESSDKLITCTATAFRKNFYRNITLVDAKCDVYKIKEAKKIGNIGPFWGFNIFLAQRIKVELFFAGTPYAISMDKLKDLICETIDKNPKLWESGANLVGLKNAIKKASTFSEIIEKFR